MPVAVPIIIGAATIASTAVAASSASNAAEQQREAQQQQIDAQRSIAEKNMTEQQRIAEEQRKAEEEALKKEELAREQARAAKQAALAKIKIPRLGETETGAELLTNIRERLAGRSTLPTITPLNVNTMTAPFAAQQRASLKEQTIPLISAEASARGVGRSTLPVNRIALESSATERNIASQAAEYEKFNKEIEARNVAAKQSEMNDALSRLQQLNQTEITLNEDIAKFELEGEFEIADDLRQDASAISQETRDLERRIADLERDISNQQAKFQLSIAELTKQQGIDAASNQLLQGQIISQGILGTAKAFTSFSSQDLKDTLSEVESERRGAGVQVGNISEQDVGLLPKQGGTGFNFGGF